MNSYIGVTFFNSSSNNIIGNNIVNNYGGIGLQNSSLYNKIYHNNFINNTNQVYIDNSSLWWNVWDDSYPSGGNYWSDYDGFDYKSGPNQDHPGSDGIGDTPHLIIHLNVTGAVDHYPLIGIFNSYAAGIWRFISEIISIVSNSAISNFRIDTTNRMISFRVAGARYSPGFCRIMIPNIIVEELWRGRFSVLLDDEPIPFNKWVYGENTFIYFSYIHSEHEIKIVYSIPPVGGKIVPETNANPSIIKFMESLSYWYVLIVLITIMVSIVISIKKKR